MKRGDLDVVEEEFDAAGEAVDIGSFSRRVSLVLLAMILVLIIPESILLLVLLTMSMKIFG